MPECRKVTFYSNQTCAKPKARHSGLDPESCGYRMLTIPDQVRNDRKDPLHFIDSTSFSVTIRKTATARTYIYVIFLGFIYIPVTSESLTLKQSL